MSFFVAQIATITCLFLAISSFFPHTVVMSQLHYIVQALGFILMVYYFVSALYFTTMTAVKAHQDLKSLATPLQQVLVMEHDVTKIQSLKILLKEVENVGPLSGNGYFDISRGTLTSIVSISVTYFIILLQFRTAG